MQTTPTPITWPSGTYGLMETAQGCPDDGYVTWSEGWRYQDTEGALIGSGNTYTWGIGNYMKGKLKSQILSTTTYILSLMNCKQTNSRPTLLYCFCCKTQF